MSAISTENLKPVRPKFILRVWWSSWNSLLFSCANYQPLKTLLESDYAVDFSLINSY